MDSLSKLVEQSMTELNISMTIVFNGSNVDEMEAVKHMHKIYQDICETENVNASKSTFETSICAHDTNPSYQSFFESCPNFKECKVIKDAQEKLDKDGFLSFSELYRRC